MGHLSLGESSKSQSYHKAHLLGELVEVKKRFVHKTVKIKVIKKSIRFYIGSTTDVIRVLFVSFIDFCRTFT